MCFRKVFLDMYVFATPFDDSHDSSRISLQGLVEEHMVLVSPNLVPTGSARSHPRTTCTNTFVKHTLGCLIWINVSGVVFRISAICF